MLQQNSSSSLLNAKVPQAHAPNNGGGSVEKLQPKGAAPKKKVTSTQGRMGKLPQTIDSNGAWSTVGLGKVFYLLDQMKIEVSDADGCIKTLQTDMKLLVRIRTQWRDLNMPH